MLDDRFTSWPPVAWTPAGPFGILGCLSDPRAAWMPPNATSLRLRRGSFPRTTPNAQCPGPRAFDAAGDGLPLSHRPGLGTTRATDQPTSRRDTGLRPPHRGPVARTLYHPGLGRSPRRTPLRSPPEFFPPMNACTSLRSPVARPKIISNPTRPGASTTSPSRSCVMPITAT